MRKHPREGALSTTFYPKSESKTPALMYDYKSFNYPNLPAVEYMAVKILKQLT